jgi:hypothetical protein
MPFAFDAAILSRIRSPVTSRSNWAKDVEGQPAHAGSGVEGLDHRHERGARRIQPIDDLGEVPKRAGQAIDLIDDDRVDLAGADVGEQPLKGRTLYVAAGEAAVVVLGLSLSTILC